MIKLKKNSKVYVACPYKLTSGGPETLHQLVDKLRNNKIDAYIYYFNAYKTASEELIDDKFKKYNVKCVTKIEDSYDNVIVIPEMNTELLYKFKKVKKVIWWLSFDFYERNIIKNRARLALKKRNLPELLWPFMIIYFSIKNRGYKQLDFLKDRDLNNYIHLYNCEYTKQILIRNNVKEECLLYLCGPLRDIFINNNFSNLQKEDIVLYNPAKGLEFTEKIIKNTVLKDQNIRFIPLENLTPDSMLNLLKRAKVYIDFGFFPGPERIPREAVSCYCNIITSNLGSAENDIDVPIPKKFKFSPLEENLNDICDTIIDQIYNYDNYVNEYNKYREKVKNQVCIFNDNINNLFKKDIEYDI